MTYLRNKANSQPKVIDLHKPTDASQHIHKTRLEANSVFFANGGGKGSLMMDTSRPHGTPLLQHAATSFTKTTGRPSDASDYTSYRGRIGVNNDSKYLGGGKITLQNCCQIETPDSSKYKGAGDATKELHCVNKKVAESPKFVDDTIRLSAMHPKMVTAECTQSATTRTLVTPNHTHSPGLCPPTNPTSAVGKRSEIMRAPPEFQNKGVGGSRIGAYFNPRSGYVENKHGNDLNVNPRRVPTAWVYTPGAPAHLKINDPTFANVKPF